MGRQYKLISFPVSQTSFFCKEKDIFKLSSKFKQLRIEMMNDLKFTSTHEWLREDNNEVTVGITDHAQQLLGDMVFVEFPKIGHKVQAGEELGVVESVKAASDFYAPISGVVTAINEFVVENPAIVNTEPYTNGWLVKLKPSNPSELENLLTAEEYQSETAEER
jgi:glycine cleavage system H protein